MNREFRKLFNYTIMQEHTKFIQLFIQFLYNDELIQFSTTKPLDLNLER